MASVIAWFELPATNLDRATAFYTAVIGSKFEKMDGYDDGVFFAHDTEGPSGEIVKGGKAKSTTDGTLIYLTAPNGVADALTKVEAAGGKIEMGQTNIGPHGFIAHVVDTEGNRVGLHSMSS